MITNVLVLQMVHFVAFLFYCMCSIVFFFLNHLTPNDHFSGRTAPLTYRRYILYIYSINISTEYFKHAAHSPFFSSSKCRLFRNATFFGVCIIHILYTGCAKIKKENSGAKGLTSSQLFNQIQGHAIKIDSLRVHNFH
jgi:hypothetical protein